MKEKWSIFCSLFRFWNFIFWIIKLSFLLISMKNQKEKKVWDLFVWSFLENAFLFHSHFCSFYDLWEVLKVRVYSNLFLLQKVQQQLVFNALEPTFRKWNFLWNCKKKLFFYSNWNQLDLLEFNDSKQTYETKFIEGEFIIIETKLISSFMLMVLAVWFDSLDFKLTKTV
jgi:hypothetical protein